MPASARNIDMTNVKEGGAFNSRQVPAGDYRLRVVDVQDGEVKRGDNAGSPQWTFVIQIATGKHKGGKYPYRCTLVENQLWKVRNLLVAAGITVPKQRLKVDPNKLIGKVVGGTLEDDEYDNKVRSQITAIFPVDELVEDDEDQDEDAAVEDTEEPEEEEIEEEVDEEEEEPEPEPVTRKVTKRAAAKKTTKPRVVNKPADDDDLDELDVEDL